MKQIQKLGLFFSQFNFEADQIMWLINLIHSWIYVWPYRMFRYISKNKTIDFRCSHSCLWLLKGLLPVHSALNVYPVHCLTILHFLLEIEEKINFWISCHFISHQKTMWSCVSGTLIQYYSEKLTAERDSAIHKMKYAVLFERLQVCTIYWNNF